jgi:hypothetical protein
MNFDPYAEPKPRIPPPPEQLRILWRMQGPSRILVAALRRHPVGHELMVGFEDDADDILETRFERLDPGRLQKRADELRQLLAERGWSELRAVMPDRSAAK